MIERASARLFNLHLFIVLVAMLQILTHQLAFPTCLRFFTLGFWLCLIL